MKKEFDKEVMFDKPDKRFSIRDVLGDNYENKHTQITVEKPKRVFKNTNQSEFFAQYKNPKWQEMRLNVMKRDGFSCAHCFSHEKTLNVHHLIYKKNVKPWEYDPDDLLTLCEDCHSKLTIKLEETISYIRRSATSKTMVDAICEIISSIRKIQDNRG